MKTSENPKMDSTKNKLAASSWLLILGIVFIALTLRSPLTSVGPIIADIKDSLGISNVVAGFITTIPLFAFAIVSPIVPKIARKISIEKSLMFATIILALGILLRSFGTITMLFLGTALIGIGISFGNVLLPGLIKLKFPLKVGIMTAIYTVAMNSSASLAAGVSYPLSTFDFGWQGSLGIWIIFAILAVLIWLPQTKNVQIEKAPTLLQNHEKKPMWRYPLAWVIMIAMGFQSMIFYTTAAWIPEIFKAQGMSAGQGGAMFSILQISQIPMTFVTPIIASKLKNQRPIVLFFGFLYLIGFVGLLMGWTDYSVLWMICIGLAGGSSFSICMMFFSLRTKDAFESADLSGFAQSLGYLCAAVGPVLYGYLHDKFNSFDTANSMYIIIVLIATTASYIAAKNRYVTDSIG